MRDRAVFRLTKPVPSDAEGTEAGDIGFIVDAAGCGQAENKPLEARSSFRTEPQKRPEVIGPWGGGNASGSEAAEQGIFVLFGGVGDPGDVGGGLAEAENQAQIRRKNSKMHNLYFSNISLSICVKCISSGFENCLEIFCG